MDKIKAILTFIILTTTLAYGQVDKAKNLITEGVALYDEGKYKEAIDKYNESYKLDSNSIVLFSEMAMTYLALKDYKNTDNICQQAIIRFPESKTLKHIYNTYGSSLDENHHPIDAIRIYTEGIGKFKGDYLLYFNKGVTEYGLKKYYDARESFKKAISINTNHISSFYYLGIIEDDFENRIPAILDLSNFLLLSPDGERAKEILPYLIKKVNNLYYQIKSEGSIATLSSAQQRTDTTKYEFYDVEKALGLMSVLSTALPDEKKTELEKFETQLQTIFELLGAEKSKHSGFYWDIVAPFFIDLEKNKQMTGFVYYINQYENTDKEVQKLIKKNKGKIEDFIKWAKAYE